MKKISFYSLFSLILLIGFTSCSKDAEEVIENATPKKAPAISGKGFDIKKPIEIYSDSIPEITVIIEATGKIESLTIEKDSKKIDLVDITKSTSNTEKGFAVALITAHNASSTSLKGETKVELNINQVFIADSMQGKSFELKINVFDVNGLGTEETLNIKVKSRYSVEVSKVVLLGAHENAKGSFYSVISDSVYTSEHAKNNADKIDFLYGYYTNGKATILAPSEAGKLGSSNLASWSTKNETLIAKSATSIFDDLIGDNNDLKQVQIKALNLFASAESSTHQVNSLEEGDVFQFVLVNGTVGVAEVVKLSTGTTGTIELSVAYIKKEIGGNTTITQN